MNIETQQQLLAEYSKLNNPRVTTAIKYYFQYKKVNVNIYFDAYDTANLSMCLILIFEKEYYYTSLNINNTEINTEYLKEIPPNILSAILDDNNQLISFYQSIETHIEQGEAIPINYMKDKFFKNTLSPNNGRKDLPFIRGIRRVPMTDKTFNNLYETMGIDRNILNQIRDRNITLVRTDKPEYRKNITLILEELNITI